MSDDLVKRLREDQPVTQDMASTMQCALQDEAADRIEELEAKLAKAVEALKFHNAAVELCIGEVTPAMKEAHYHTKRTLAELTGEGDNSQPTRYDEYGHYGENNPPVGSRK